MNPDPSGKLFPKAFRSNEDKVQNHFKITQTSLQYLRVMSKDSLNHNFYQQFNIH